MKIVYCIQSIHNSGGMERVLTNKANYLIEKLNYDVYIVTTDRKKRDAFFSFSPKIKFIDLGINYEDNSQKNIFLKIPSQYKKLISHKRKLSEVLRTINPDITISMFGMEVFFLPKIKAGGKKILEFHFSKYYKLINSSNIINRIAQKIRLRKWEKIIPKYDAFITLTKRDMNDWGNFANGYVIPNMFTGSSIVDNASSNKNYKTVIAAGRLAYQKGFDLLIDAWSSVKQRHPDWKLKICGDGPLKEELQTRINNQNLSEQITLMGNISDLKQEFFNSNFFVLSSRYEGLPMVLIEAMGNNLPIISFDCPCGPSDIISDKIDGILVPPNNTELLAQAIINLIENPNLQKKIKSNIPAKLQSFGEDIVMHKWVDIFNKIQSE